MHATLAIDSSMDPAPIPHYRPLKRVEYDKLIELGAFQNEKIELLEGLLVPMSPMSPPHSSAVQKLTAILVSALAERATVRIQSPFAALDLSETEPDVSVVPLGDYDTAHPDRAYLIIEVAESSLSVDRGVKQRLYAGCDVSEYWIVNVVARSIEVYSDSRGGAYAKVARFEPGQSLSPIHFGDVVVRVSDVVK